MKKKSSNKKVIKGRWYNINKKLKKDYLQNIIKLKIGKWIQRDIF